MLKKWLWKWHGWLGLAAGLVLLCVGLSGALLSFEKEIVRLLNPQVFSARNESSSRMSPAEILRETSRLFPGKAVSQVTVEADAAEPVSVMLAPAKGERRGKTYLLDPYSGVVLDDLHGADFFSWMLRFHRWLLLPNSVGSVITGSACVVLLLLGVSGLYLRWPRYPLRPAVWFRIDRKLQGRRRLHNLHTVLGTVFLLPLLVSSITGTYLAFHPVRDLVDAMAGVPKREAPMREAALRETTKRETTMLEIPRREGLKRAPQNPSAESAVVQPEVLERAWRTFEGQSKGFLKATVRLQDRSGAISINYLDQSAAHERAMNVMRFSAEGSLVKQERYADRGVAARFVGSFFPLHTGSVFGTAGKALMMASSLALVFFVVTGVLMMVLRRRRKRDVVAADESEGVVA